MKQHTWICGLASLAWSVVSWAGAADKPGAIAPEAVNLGRPISFDDDVRPLLDSNCTACHNSAIAESKLNLEDVPAMLKGGKRGPAVVAKDPDKSLIYQLAARSHDPVMPPLPNKVSAAAFTPKDLGVLRQWILEGAPAGADHSEATVDWQPVPSGLKAIYGLGMSTWGRFIVAGRANQLDVYDLGAQAHVGRLTDPALGSLMRNGKPLYPHGAAHQDLVHAVAYSPTADLVATGGFREVKLWERPAPSTLGQFPLEHGATALSASPDGTLLAVAGADMNVRLIRFENQQVVHTLAGATAPVSALAFSRDGTKVFAVGKDKMVRAWNLGDGQPAGQLETPAEILCLEFAADGTKLYTGHVDNHIRGWAVPFEAPKPAEGDKPAEPVKPVVQMPGHGGAVTVLTLMPNAPTQLASASLDGHWRIWDLNNGNQIRAHGHGGPVTQLAVRPDGQFLATASGSSFKLWKIDGNQVVESRDHFGHQRQTILETDHDAVGKARIALADAAMKAAEKTFKEREEALKKAKEAKEAAEKALADARMKEQAAKTAAEAAQQELAAKPDDEALKKKKADADAALAKEVDAVKKAADSIESASRAITQAEKLLQSADELHKAAIQRHAQEVERGKGIEATLNAAKALPQQVDANIVGLKFSSDGQAVFALTTTGLVRSWGSATGRPLDAFTASANGALLGTMTTGNRWITTGEDKLVTLCDAHPGWRLVARLGPKADAPTDVAGSPFVNRVLSLAFSPDGKLLATGGGDPSRSGQLIVWDVASRSVVKKLPEAHSDTVFGLDFSRDGKLLASCAADKFVKVHDVETGKLYRSFEGHTNHVLDVAWKADGSFLTSAGADNAIKVWNVESGEQHRTIQNYSKQVTTIQYIGVTDNIASASGDKSIKFHRSTDGGNYRGFGGPTDYVYSVAVTRDEAILATGGEDGVLRVFNGQNGQTIVNFEAPAPPANAQQAAR